jgi:hypothetical protein
MSTPRSTVTKAARPSLARKVTPKSEATREDALDEGVRMVVDGVEYVVRIGDMTSPVAREFRRNYGASFNALRDELAGDPDLDSIAAFMWLAKRMEGEAPDFAEITVTYAQMLEGFEITTAGPSEVEDSPEA